jgi:hypothetical protein
MEFMGQVLVTLNPIHAQSLIYGKLAFIAMRK